MALDSIAVSVFVVILIEFDKYNHTIRNKYPKKSDCEISWLVQSIAEGLELLVFRLSNTERGFAAILVIL